MNLYQAFFYYYKKIYTLRMKKKFICLNSYLDPRVDVRNAHFINIGKAIIRPYKFIYAITGDNTGKNKFKPYIEIQDGCDVGRFCHITCTNKVIIEKNVLFGEGIFIADNIHGYEDIKTPIKKQTQISSGPLIIGEGTWIGNGARVIGKLKVGKNCVIGANTFLNKDVPDYSVVVGVPARIIKKYEKVKKIWIKTDERL